MNKKNLLNFQALVETIQSINTELAKQASSAVNVSLTLRNWLIGGYIHDYELSGSDRAVYGDRLIEKLSQSLIDLFKAARRKLKYGRMPGLHSQNSRPRSVSPILRRPRCTMAPCCGVE
jgi:hypothetical protein